MKPWKMIMAFFVLMSMMSTSSLHASSNLEEIEASQIQQLLDDLTIEELETLMEKYEKYNDERGGGGSGAGNGVGPSGDDGSNESTPPEFKDLQKKLDEITRILKNILNGDQTNPI